MGVPSRSFRFGAPLAVALCCAAFAVTLLARTAREARDLRLAEEAALADLRALRDAELAFRERRLLDANADGIPEHGSLARLADAGLVSRPVLRDAEGPHLASGGYRLEILLPERAAAEGRRRLARGDAVADPVLAAESFALVALPRGGRTSGLRGFYLDERGRLWVAEGVVEDEDQRVFSPPAVTLERNEEDDLASGPSWRSVTP